MRRYLLAVLLVACSEEPAAPRPTAPIEPAGETADLEATGEPGELPADDEVSEEPDEEPDDAIAEDEAPSFSLYAQLIEGDSIDHPDPHVRRVLEGLLESVSRFAMGEAVRRAPSSFDEERADEDYETTAGGGCDVHLLHEHLVTFACHDEYTSRMDTSARAHAFHFTIAGGDVLPFDPISAFTSSEAFGARLRTRCEEAVREAGEDDMRIPYGASCERLVVTLGSDAVTAVFATAETNDGDDAFEDPIELPYEDIPDLLPEDGLLRRLFAEQDPAAPPPVTDADATAVSRTDLAHHLLAQWQALDPTVAARVGMWRWEHGLAQLVFLADDAAAATAIATRLGATPRPVDLPSRVTPLRPAWMTNGAALNVRSRPTGPVIALLPEGTIVSLADRSDRGRLVAIETPLFAGYAGRNLLSAHSGCIPRAPDGFVPTEQPLTALVRVRRAGTSSDAVLFAQGARVALHDLEASSCAVGPERALVELDGPLRDLRLTATTANGGDTILVIGTADPDAEEARYVAHAIGRDEPVWTATVPLGERGASGVRLSETVDGTYFPISIQRGGDLARLAWTGSALEERAPEE